MSNTFKVFAICIIVLLVIVLVTPAIMYMWLYELQAIEKKQDLETEILVLESENAELREKLTIIRGERDKLQGELTQKIEEWLDAWEVKPVEITGYAPLDPRAIEGWDYQGDPNVTNSGAQTTPGITVAAPIDIPFGIRVYVEGAMRVVQDRGGRVDYNEAGLIQLDLCVETREEALDGIGRREALAVIEKGAE